MHQRLGTQPTAALSAAGIRVYRSVQEWSSAHAYAGGMCPLSCRLYIDGESGASFLSFWICIGVGSSLTELNWTELKPTIKDGEDICNFFHLCYDIWPFLHIDLSMNFKSIFFRVLLSASYCRVLTVNFSAQTNMVGWVCRAFGGAKKKKHTN